MPTFSETREAMREAFRKLDLVDDAPNSRVAGDRIRAAERLVYGVVARYARLHSLDLVSCDECVEDYPRDWMCRDDDSYLDWCPRCVSESAHDIDYPGRRFIRDVPEEDEEEGEPDGLYDNTANPIKRLGTPFRAMPGEHIHSKTRFFGLEVEFEADWSEVEEMIQDGFQGIAILKSDGSLTNSGAECCTVPLTRGAAERDLRVISEILLSHGARAWNRASCGLHVHVSRASASMLTWGKVDRFFANRGNDKFLDAIAGRSGNRYCQRAYEPKQRLAVARDKMRCGMDRYHALNFSTNGKPTVEFRLFRGNVSYGGMMRAVEFCDSIICWAETCGADDAMHAFVYIGWLKQRAAAYPTLTSYMRKKSDEDMREAA